MDASFIEHIGGSGYAILAALLVGVVGLVIILCWTQTSRKSGSSEDETKEPSSEDELHNGSDNKTGGKSKQPSRGKLKQQTSSSKKVVLPSHLLLAADFKGHTGAILSVDFDSNGKYLATCSEDRTIRLWYMKTLQDKEHKYIRKNIELDHATHIKFSPDGTAVVVCLAVANNLHVYRINKPHKGGSLTLSDVPVEFPKHSSSSILSLGLASTGKFIMTYTDTGFTVWTLKGEVLATVQTHHAPNTCAAVSPCGRFIACAGFTSDVKLWEVEFSKTGDFNQVTRAMELKGGHRASVTALTFSGGSNRMGTVSKDGTWKFWNIDVSYKLSEDTKLLMTGDLPEQSDSPLIAISADTRVCAVSLNTSIYIYATESGKLAESLVNVHRDTISGLIWEPSSAYLVSAGGGDRHVRVWHNAPGKKQLLIDLQSSIAKATSEPLKQRLQQQIEETKELLKSLNQL